MQQAISTFATSLARVVDGNLEEFARSLRQNGTEDNVKRFFALAELFLRNDIVPSDTKIIDHRYFYVMPAVSSASNRVCGHGYAVCGVARDILAGMLRKHKTDSQFLRTSWVNSCRDLTNPSSRGFVAEQIVISAICSNGLVLGSLTYKPTENTMFTAAESVPLVKEVGCLQFVPQAYNYKHVDSLMRLVGK